MADDESCHTSVPFLMKPKQEDNKNTVKAGCAAKQYKYQWTQELTGGK